MSVIRVREAVKWIKASPSRSRYFKEIAKIANVDTSKFLCMDVPTRWNSTYLMLEATLPYEPAMRLFQTLNPDFASDLKERKHKKMSIGVPTELDWIEVKRMCGFREQFYNLTRLVSGSHYVTSHQVLMELCDMISLITDLEEDEDDGLRNMAVRMRLKIGKYWLEETELNPKMNKILYIAAMLDPRQKMKHVEHCLKLVYGSTRANELLEELNKQIYDLYEAYKAEMAPILGQTQPRKTTQNAPVTNRSANLRFLGKGKKCSLGVINNNVADMSDQTELTRYLSDSLYVMTEDEVDNFDILEWWKKYTTAFPIRRWQGIS